MPSLPSTAMRVPLHTAPRVNRRVQEGMMERVRSLEDADEMRLKKRLHDLDLEWDTERVLETNAAGLAIIGAVLGAVHSRKWLLLSGLASVFLLQHALQGWCPQLPLLRRLGVRTLNEIEAEKETVRRMIARRMDTYQPAEAAE